jgi:hypothetical protein
LPLPTPREAFKLVEKEDSWNLIDLASRSSVSLSHSNPQLNPRHLQSVILSVQISRESSNPNQFSAGIAEIVGLSLSLSLSLNQPSFILSHRSSLMQKDQNWRYMGTQAQHNFKTKGYARSIMSWSLLNSMILTWYICPRSGSELFGHFSFLHRTHACIWLVCG